MKKACFFLWLSLASTGLMAQDIEAFAALFEDEPMADTLEMNPEDSVDLAELAFRHMFKNNMCIKPRKSKYYIISFLHCADHLYLDPEGYFMDRLQDIRPKVRSATYFYNRRDKLEGKVVIFFVTDMSLIAPDLAIVKGGYYQSMDACAGNRYLFRFDRGVWELERVVLEWQI